MRAGERRDALVGGVARAAPRGGCRRALRREREGARGQQDGAGLRVKTPIKAASQSLWAELLRAAAWAGVLWPVPPRLASSESPGVTQAAWQRGRKWCNFVPRCHSLSPKKCKRIYPEALLWIQLKAIYNCPDFFF